MSKVAFTLVNNTFINLSFCFPGGRYRAFTGQRIDPKYWNSKAQRARADSQFPDYLTLNHLLDTYNSRILEYYRNCLIKSIIPTKEGFKAALNAGLNNEKNILIADFIQSIIDERKNSPDFAVNTIKKYVATLNLFKAFSEFYKLRPRMLDTSLELLNKFKSFLLTERKLSINTVHKYLKIIRSFLNEARRRDFEVNIKYELFSMHSQAIRKFYLNMDELKLLINHPFDQRLRNAVDFFLIGAFTGLRFGDFSKLAIENIEIISGREIIRVKQAKTGGVVYIPVHPVVKNILNSYSGLPRAITQQRLNNYIKEACKLVGISSQTVVYFNHAGRDSTRIVPKHDIISSHTARRSFATNAYKAGIPSMDIMRITGHKTESSFKRYICIDDEEAAVNMAGNKFFN